MDNELHEHTRFSRIRRVKKLLRYMPRKATVHKYPFIKFFANFARKRHYLWSFRSAEVVPALYAGFMLTFAPLYGVQIPVAFALALIFRANLMILVALQLISNPLTIVPIYATAYQIGHFLIDLVGATSADLAAESYSVETSFKMAKHAGRVLHYFKEMMVGGLAMGYVCGFISSFIYQYVAYRYTLTHPPKKFRNF